LPAKSREKFVGGVRDELAEDGEPYDEVHGSGYTPADRALLGNRTIQAILSSRSSNVSPSTGFLKKPRAPLCRE
jgi:hypothetical protein